MRVKESRLRMSLRCRRCPEHSQCVQCRRREDNDQSKQKPTARDLAREIISLACRWRADDPWLLADDGYAMSGRVDRQAVAAAADGLRRVRLTTGERELAATAIIRDGGTVREVCVRLGLPSIPGEEDTCPPTTVVRLPGSLLGYAG